MAKYLADHDVITLNNNADNLKEASENLSMDFEEISTTRKRAHEESSSSEDPTINHPGKEFASSINPEMTKKKQVKKKNIVKQIEIQKPTPKSVEAEVNSLSYCVTSGSQVKDIAENERYSLFSTKDRGPFCIFLKQSKEDATTKPKSALDIARVLYVTGIKFQEILPISRICWKIIFCSGAEANKVIKSSLLKDRHFEAFIPGFLTRRKGVIQGIPLDLSIKELQEYIEKENDVVVINAFRLKRRNKQTGSWENSGTVCVEFKGSNLPESIYMWRIRVAVHPYIPMVRICFKCGRIGHIGRTCDSEERCLTCSEAHVLSKEERCTANKKCINCEGYHTTLDKSSRNSRDTLLSSRL